MRSLIYLSLLLVAIQAHRIQNQFFVDQDGLKRIYHGVNVIYKIAPYYPPISDRFDANDSLSDEDLANLKKWGMNIIRLYVSWEGTEAVRGQYNTTYLEQVKLIADRAAKFDIQIVLDSHQDVYSRFFCGEGFPDWAVSQSNFVFPYPVRRDFDRDEKGYPDLEQCLKGAFGLYYFSMDAAKTLQDLYDNVNQVGDHYAEFWGFVANYFKDVPNVLGYEVFNEPLGGSPYHNVLELIYPGKGNQKNLLPLYQKISEQIRKYDQEKLLFFEPAISDYFGGGFSDSPGGLTYRDREVYTYHIYCPLIDSNSIPKNDLACKLWDKVQFWRKEKSAKALNVGKFLSEFGAISDDPRGAKELNYILGNTESLFTSWAYWEFKYYADITTQAKPGNIESFYDQNGNLYTEKVKTLARPYATAICGEPLQTSFDPYNSIHFFLLDWKASNNCNGKHTRIFLSEEFYFQKKKIQFKNCDQCKLEQVEKSYYDVVLPEGFQEGQQVILHVVQI